MANLLSVDLAASIKSTFSLPPSDYHDAVRLFKLVYGNGLTEFENHPFYLPDGGPNRSIERQLGESANSLYFQAMEAIAREKARGDKTDPIQLALPGFDSTSYDPLG